MSLRDGAEERDEDRTLATEARDFYRETCEAIEAAKAVPPSAFVLAHEAAVQAQAKRAWEQREDTESTAAAMAENDGRFAADPYPDVTYDDTPIGGRGRRVIAS